MTVANAKFDRKITSGTLAEPAPANSVEDPTRRQIARSLILSFEDVPSVGGYKDQRSWVSPTMASDLLKLNYTGQRNVRLDQVRVLTSAMASKTGYAPNNVIALSYNPDDPTDTSLIALLNGQHTLHSIIASDTVQPLIISLFPCREPADIEFHYALFDQGRARNLSDVSRAIGLADTIRHHSLPKQALNALGAAGTLIRAHLTDARFAPKDKLRSARVSRDWMAETALAYSLLAAPDRRISPGAPPIGELGKLFRKRLVSPSFFAVALVALRSHPQDTGASLRDLIAMADSADRGDVAGDQFVWDVVDFLTETSLGSGTDRRIATRNFIHLLVELRARQRGCVTDHDVTDIVTDATPSIKESDALWDLLVEDRLDLNGTPRQSATA